jgi:hypothetical protein
MNCKGRPPEAKFANIGWRANFELYDTLSEYGRLFPGSALCAGLFGVMCVGSSPSLLPQEYLPEFSAQCG